MHERISEEGWGLGDGLIGRKKIRTVGSVVIDGYLEVLNDRQCLVDCVYNFCQRKYLFFFFFFFSIKWGFWGTTTEIRNNKASLWQETISRQNQEELHIEHQPYTTGHQNQHQHQR